MSRREWRCRNRDCPADHGAVLGQLTNDLAGLVLQAGVTRFRFYLDSHKVDVICPICGTVRTFRGAVVYSSRLKGTVH